MRIQRNSSEHPRSIQLESNEIQRKSHEIQIKFFEIQTKIVEMHGTLYEISWFFTRSSQKKRLNSQENQPTLNVRIDFWAPKQEGSVHDGLSVKRISHWSIGWSSGSISRSMMPRTTSQLSTVQVGRSGALAPTPRSTTCHSARRAPPWSGVRWDASLGLLNPCHRWGALL